MTTSHQSKFLRILSERGFIHQCTAMDELDALFAEGERTKTPVAAYIGFDCTAPSLHVGSLIQIMILHWLQQCGHKPIVLMGGGTTKVGDPSGRDESRKLLDADDIAANIAGIKQIFSRFLRFGEGTGDALMVNNDAWLASLNYIDLLRDVGRHFSINRMLTMDSVKLRLEREQELSFLEFNYMILQAYDFVELHKRYGCRVQCGGSDQWGNIVSGVELNRRMRAAANQAVEPIFGLTTPLLATASGAKMGKTASGAVWLNADMLSAYDYWQYWRNTEDGDVGRFLRLFTTLPMEEIHTLEALQGADINEAKKRLATEITTLCHGAAAAQQAAETARKTFEEGAAGEALPEITLPRAQLEAGIPAHELFRLAGLADSGGEARRLIRGKGARVDGEVVVDENQVITAAALGEDGFIKLSAGKKKHALVKAG